MIPNTIAKKCSLVRGMGAAHRLAQCSPQNSTAHATAAYSTTKSSSSQESTLIARVKDFAANAAAETYSAAMLQALAPYGTSSSRSASSTNAPVRPRSLATAHSGLAMGRCSMVRNMSSSPRSKDRYAMDYFYPSKVTAVEYTDEQLANVCHGECIPADETFNDCLLQKPTNGRRLWQNVTIDW
mmetsp:Transcript_62590/g.146898  ORF Transcript_62590/g.146898 Transcript_62590/m.146898 type:complete len:184 (-) Transcript_62590:43-594(-)